MKILHSFKILVHAIKSNIRWCKNSSAEENIIPHLLPNVVERMILVPSVAWYPRLKKSIN